MQANPIDFLKIALCVLVIVTFLSPAGAPAHAGESFKFSLNETLGLPDWFSIKGEHRVRYEYLDNQFRAGSNGSDQILSLRTLAQARFSIKKNFEVNLELQDSRAELADSGSLMNATIVNAAELLEANIVWKSKNLFLNGDSSYLRGGRFTLDLGKRRFIARNRFRNVIQAYTGLDWKWTAENKNFFRAIATMPVNREPTQPAQLLQNDASFDEETLDTVLWGVFFFSPHLPGKNKGEAYFFGFHEDDGRNFNTRNREIYTPGFRIFRSPEKGQFDYELESMFQFGTVRNTNSPQDTRDLDQFGYFFHAEAGYSFIAPLSPRLYLEYDLASGDDDPTDNQSGRFQRFFGPNVPEFGPTSIHTAFVRANISSPGIRIQLRPNPNILGYFSYRALWLASSTDGWRGSSGLRDPMGGSGSFLGHLLFLRGIWKAHSNIRFETGIAYRIDGEFQERVAGSPLQGNSLYTYCSTTLSF